MGIRVGTVRQSVFKVSEVEGSADADAGQGHNDWSLKRKENYSKRAWLYSPSDTASSAVTTDPYSPGCAPWISFSIESHRSRGIFSTELRLARE